MTSLARRAFAHYLRTGRRLPMPFEQKFNPWHDPRDGRFTFGPGGAGLARAGAVTPARRHPSDTVSSFEARAEPISLGAGQTLGMAPKPRRPLQETGIGTGTVIPQLRRFHPLNPANHSIHIVKRGESLAKIAATRNGVSVSDLAWLNRIDPSKPIHSGQQIKLPNQDYLDAGRAAKNNFLKLDYYMTLHNRQLPPNPAKAPDFLDPLNWQHVNRNGYDYALDGLLRTRRVSGTITLNPDQTRSRVEQARAGKPHRRSTDEGGHYIAREFNGPREAFNHFAQDRNFNRRSYRALELKWKSEVKRGLKVTVDILPVYQGVSLRPKSIIVIYNSGGHFEEISFNNRSGGK